MKITKKLKELYSVKKKIFLLLLFVCYPVINFFLLNTNQIKFITGTFYLFFIIFISFFFISFLIILCFTRINFSFGLFFSIALFFNLEIYYHDLGNFFFENKYLKVLFIFVISFIFYFLIKKKFTQLFLFIYIIISITHSAIIFKPYKIFNKKVINTSVEELNVASNESINLSNKPNVFYFILDALGSISNLENNGINTKPIYDYLVSNGYKISLDSKSNYTETSLTLSSIYNLDYIVDGVNKFYTNTLNKGSAANYDYYPFFSKYQKIPLVNELDRINYKFFRIENSFARCNQHIKIKCIKIFNHTFSSNFYNDYALEVFFKSSLIFSIIKNKYDKDHIDSYDTIEHYKKIFFSSRDELNHGGNFVFIHHMSPHRPMRSENCRILEHPEKNLFTYKNYNSSVKCVFSRIKEINEIILSTYPNSIIVFQGDHGPIFEEDRGKEGSSKKPNIKLIKNRISHFNAMLIPSRCEEKFYDKIGNIESIRLVLNCIGVKKIEPRKNSKTFIFYPNENPKIHNIKNLF